MKSLFTLLMIAATTLTAQATDYTERLLVVVNGDGTEQEATITVTEHDGLYDLNLKNFVLMGGDTPMPVGNVELTNMIPAKAGEAIFLQANQNITVTNGDDTSYPFWMGPMLGELPVKLVAVLEDNQLRALINLDLMSQMGQIVEVRFGETLVTGKGYHIPNSGFEEWHVSTDEYVEPNAWHSFESASGMFAQLAGHHIEKSDNGRNGTTCARIFSTSIFSIVANGTMTTGRMNAGSFSATDPTNNAYLDMSKTDVDGNGDPYYVALNHRPDSLVLWVKFNQGTANTDHPYATVSAVITDGTYYQDPEDKAYDNVVARASDHAITVTNDDWRRVSVPFVYTINSADPRAIIITISTNADAGQGSDGDEVLVDDITLVYNSRLKSLNVEGFDPNKFDYELDNEQSFAQLAPQTDANEAYLLQTLEPGAETSKAIITVYSADLLSNTTYTIKFKNSASGVAELKSAQNEADTYYSLGGQQVIAPRSGEIYVVRRSDGSTVKIRR